MHKWWLYDIKSQRARFSGSVNLSPPTIHKDDEQRGNSRLRSLPRDCSRSRRNGLLYAGWRNKERKTFGGNARDPPRASQSRISRNSRLSTVKEIKTRRKRPRDVLEINGIKTEKSGSSLERTKKKTGEGGQVCPAWASYNYVFIHRPLVRHQL